MKECIGLIGGHSGDSLVDKLHMRGFKVALVGGKPSEPGMITADSVLIEDLGNFKKIADFFLTYSVRYIIVGTGHIKAITLAKYLEDHGFMVSINYHNSLLAKDKVLFKTRIAQLNILTPSYLSFNDKYDIKQIITDIGLPCVIKSSTDAIQPQKANSSQELEDAIREVRATNTEVLVEKYINGNDCTVAIACDGVNMKSLGVLYYSKAKAYNLKGFDNAYSQKLPIEVENDLISLSMKIVDELNFTGLVRIDFIVDKDIYVLELNSVIVTGYSGSAYPYFKKQGVDIAEVMTDTMINIYKNKLNRTL